MRTGHQWGSMRGDPCDGCTEMVVGELMRICFANFGRLRSALRGMIREGCAEKCMAPNEIVQGGRSGWSMSMGYGLRDPRVAPQVAPRVVVVVVVVVVVRRSSSVASRQSSVVSRRLRRRRRRRPLPSFVVHRRRRRRGRRSLSSSPSSSSSSSSVIRCPSSVVSRT